MSTIYKILTTIITILILLFLPWVSVKFAADQRIIQNEDDLRGYDAAIVFGAHVTQEGEPTEILRERLDAAVYVYENENVDRIVVSNTQKAAEVMRDYLQEQGIPTGQIDMDTEAELTSDSCAYEEEQHFSDRGILFLSQGYHLPRLVYLCDKEHVAGDAFPVENLDITEKSTVSAFTKYRIRATRYVREAVLTWVAVLGLYG